jgi:CheY-like chemotaxis protein
MPNMDGIETIRLINDKYKKIKYPNIIMISAFNKDSVINLANDVGVDMFLQKPFEPSTLYNMLNDVLIDDKEIAQEESLENILFLKDIPSLIGNKILLVEDNKVNQEIVIGLLESSGLIIDIANNGKEAIDIFAEKGNEYSLIFMDLQMPIVDGYEATIEIKKINQDIPIVALTANTMPEDIEKTKALGIHEHLGKPIKVDDIYNVLYEYILPDIEVDMLMEEEFEEIEEVNLTKNLHTLSSKNILLVEDNIINQEIIVEILKNIELNIDLANNGQEAIDIFNKNKEKYDLILMDIQMPILNGYEATTAIRNINKDIPIIALTANVMKEDIEKTKAAGMNEHLSKPIDVEKLYEMIYKYIKITTKDNNTKEENISEDNSFYHIDKQKALKLILGNEKLFNKILLALLPYKDIIFEDLDDERFAREIHTLKGLSANAGATKLHKILIVLNDTLDKSLLPEFNDEFTKVINEIKQNISIENEVKNIEKEPISDDEKNQLFAQLEEAILSKQPKKCQPVLDNLEKYTLEKEDEELFQQIKALIKKYKFKEALKLF